MPLLVKKIDSRGIQYISTLVMLTITTSPLHNKFLITYQYHLKPLTLKVQTIFLLLVP